jgi:dTMP kinase
MEQQSAAFYENVRDAYLALAAKEPDRFHLIDGRDRKDMVAQQIWKVVSAHV